jgi:hypothetical protein
VRTIQVFEDKWYRVGYVPLHECCGCGLVHRVEYKLERGMIFERWRVDRKETDKARRARKKAK